MKLTKKQPIINIKPKSISYQEPVIKDSDPSLANMYRVFHKAGLDLIRFGTDGLKKHTLCSQAEKYTTGQIYSWNQKKYVEIKNHRLNKGISTIEKTKKEEEILDANSSFCFELITLALTVPNLRDSRERILDRFEQMVTDESNRLKKELEYQKNLKK